MKKWEDFLVSKIVLHKFLYKNQHPAYRSENIHSEGRETREKVFDYKKTSTTGKFYSIMIGQKRKVRMSDRK